MSVTRAVSMNKGAAIQSDIVAIKKLGEDYFSATNAGDTDSCIATMAPDVVIMPPNQRTISGVQQLRPVSREYRAKFEAKYELVYDEIEVLGDLAIVRSTVTGTRRLRSGGASEHLLWRNLWVVKRTDGQWRFWRIIFNTPDPLPAD